MAVSICEHCGNDYHWEWEWAFDKFGFNDGDGQVETWNVAYALEQHDYDVKVEEWGMHNTVIISIQKDGKELIPGDDKINLGYDNPRGYLLEDVIAILDSEFPTTWAL